MKGYIYIASAFHTVNRSVCGQGGAWIDNDPHFWEAPPTWGICRSDLRKNICPGDYAFFVLPIDGKHPQMIFAWLKACEKVTHLEAFHRPELMSKRMGSKNPNGNIIVDAQGGYNRFDRGVHRDSFEAIKEHYVIGSESESKMLTDREIRSLAPQFLSALEAILGVSGLRAIDIISRKGRRLNESQVEALAQWLKAAGD